MERDQPLTYRIDEVRRTLGLGTTKIYQLIGAGLLDARKAGSRTLITGESLRQYVAALPKAHITTGQTDG
jgi:excisionase family DNA binding protein